MSDGFQKTYEIVVGPPVEAFASYETRVAAAYAELIESAPDEASLQRFLERNPCMVPGMRSLGILPSAFPSHTFLISQPMLPGLATRIPDFLWIAYTSVGIYPTSIEIERPSKRLFTSAGVPTAEFTQARHQLSQWSSWFSQPENQVVFKREYGVADASDGSGILQPKFVLIYGRRAELEDNQQLRRERALLLKPETESLLSYDRLQPDPMLANAITVRASGHGRFRAIAIAPTFTLGPRAASRLLLVDELEEVIDSTLDIPAERRAFLRERIPYWKRWARERKRSIVNSGECE